MRLPIPPPGLQRLFYNEIRAYLNHWKNQLYCDARYEAQPPNMDACRGMPLMIFCIYSAKWAFQEREQFHQEY